MSTHHDYVQIVKKEILIEKGVIIYRANWCRKCGAMNYTHHLRGKLIFNNHKHPKYGKDKCETGITKGKT